MNCAQQIAAYGVAPLCFLETIFANLVSAVSIFASLIFLVMFLAGGFRYLTSGGDAKQAEQAKGTLTMALLGLILIVASYIILSLISGFTGVQLTTFRIKVFSP